MGDSVTALCVDLFRRYGGTTTTITPYRGCNTQGYARRIGGCCDLTFHWLAAVENSKGWRRHIKTQ